MAQKVPFSIRRTSEGSLFVSSLAPNKLSMVLTGAWLGYANYICELASNFKIRPRRLCIHRYRHLCSHTRLLFWLIEPVEPGGARQDNYRFKSRVWGSRLPILGFAKYCSNVWPRAPRVQIVSRNARPRVALRPQMAYSQHSPICLQQMVEIVYAFPTAAGVSDRWSWSRVTGLDTPSRLVSCQIL